MIISSLNKEGYAYYEMKQWNFDKKTWITYSAKQSLQELFNTKEFIEFLKKSSSYDFGNVCIIFEPNKILEFKFVKEGYSITFDSNILETGRSEYDFLRLNLKLSFPKFTFIPKVGICPSERSSCSVCQIDDLMSILTAGKVEPDLKWVWLDEKCYDFVSQQTLELCDIHFLIKYENEAHDVTHKMGCLQRIETDGVKRN